MILLMIS